MNEPYRTEVINVIKAHFPKDETKNIESWNANELAGIYSVIDVSCHDCPYHLSMACDGITEADYNFGGYNSCEDIVKIVLTDDIYCK